MTQAAQIRSKGGRPSKYAPVVVDDICKALRSGAPIRIACGYAGIDEATYHVWQKRYPEFRERAMRARYGQAVRNLDLIQQAAPDDHRAAETALRLSFPEHFSRRVDVAGQMELSGEQTVRHELRIDTTPSELAAAVSMAMAAQGAGEMPTGTVIDVPRLETRTEVVQRDEPASTIVNGRRRYVEPGGGAEP